jgi:hypothetical protein
MALLGTAQVALARGDLQAAREDASKARTIAREVGDHLRAANSGFWLAYALALDSQIESARRAIDDAQQDARRSGYPLLVVDSLIGQTVIAVADADLETARQLVPEVAHMLREQRRWDDLGSCLRLAAGIEFKRGDPVRSAVLLGASRRWTTHLDFQDELLLPELSDLDEQLVARLGDVKLADLGRQGSQMTVDAIAGFLAAT